MKRNSSTGHIRLRMWSTLRAVLLTTLVVCHCGAQRDGVSSNGSVVDLNLNEYVHTSHSLQEEGSLERLAENLGLVDRDGKAVALTTTDGTQLEAHITAVQQSSEMIPGSNDTRNFMKYLSVKALYSLIDALKRKDRGESSENLCESTTCQQNSSQPYCTPLDGSCVECLSDQTCENPSFPFCFRNDCKQCMTSFDCLGNRVKKICGSENQSCKECIVDSDCQGKENKKCDPITSTCVQCVDDGDCDVLYPCTLSDGCPPQYCTANNVCSPCTIDSHCAFCPPTPSCGPISLINQARRRPRVGGARSLAQITEETVIPTTCLQCVEDDDCLKFNGTRNFCESSLCSQCRNDTTCPEESPFCVGGNCKKCPNGEDSCPQERNCQSSIDCPADLVPFCGGSLNNSCVECTLNEHCELPNPICGANNTCTQCSEDADCGPPNSFCVNSRCSGCKTDDQCQSPLPKCSIDDATCVQCLSAADCPDEFAGCEPTSRTCVEV